ncbi:MAG: 30S ribosomal protein S17 [Erysipelotrichaceae bacterium]|nr:30S ribosomal protein S17 [Erysipelotrichaceae bacterium]
MERNTQVRRTVQGVVISDKNDKTIVVLVETHKKHPIYGKRVKYGKKYYAHDENNDAKNGDTVTIMETRRLSATKRFRLVSIDKKAELTVKEAEAELKEEILEAAVSESVEEVKPVVEEKPAEEAEPKSQVEEVKVEEESIEKPAAKKVTVKKTSTAKKPAEKKEEE